MTEHSTALSASPSLIVSGYASVDYAMQLAPFEGHDATTIVRARADEWPRYGGIAHVTRAAGRATEGGARVTALSWVGGDSEGEAWMSAVEAGGADTAGVARMGCRSPSSYLLYPEGEGTICLFDPGDCHGGLTGEQRELLLGADLLVVTVGPAKATEQLLGAIPAGCAVFWIVKQDPASLTGELAAQLAARARVVALSEGERGYLDGIAAAARTGTYVIVTRGSRGAELLCVDSVGHLATVGEVPVRPVAGVDTTGAGDTFSGALAAALAGDPDANPDEMLAHLARASKATAEMLRMRSAAEPQNSNGTEDEKRNA